MSPVLLLLPLVSGHTVTTAYPPFALNTSSTHVTRFLPNVPFEMLISRLILFSVNHY